MERQFHNEDFERFLRDNANQYRMYPSEKVWKGIYSSIHTRRRWYGISALALLLISGALISLLTLKNNPGKVLLSEKENIDNSAATNKNNTLANGDILVSKQSSNNSSTINKTESVYNPTLLNSNNSKIVTTYLPQNPSLNTPGSLVEEATQTTEESKINNSSEVKNSTVLKDETGNLLLSTKESVSTKNQTIAQNNKAAQTDINKASMALASKNVLINTTKKASRLTAQVFFTPAVSYRKLSENKAYAANATNSPQPFTYTQLTDVNNLVKHKPAMGLEFGIESRYEFNNQLAATAALQFNINHYDIRAYFHPTEIATIALNSGGYRPDSVTALSNYRNFDGYSPNWIENFYFQVSLPVGAEFTLLRDKKFEWGIDASVQPTYLIGDRAYLITSDYKNYVKVPNLMRRWNLNTGLGAFVSYSTGRIKWHVGPQVRYQHFSSFENIYPVKENLFNVGLKVGAKINKK